MAPFSHNYPEKSKIWGIFHHSVPQTQTLVCVPVSDFPMRAGIEKAERLRLAALKTTKVAILGPRQARWKT